MKNVIKSMRSRIFNTLTCFGVIFIAVGFCSCKNNNNPQVQNTALAQAIASFDSLKALYENMASQFNAANIKVDELTTRASTLDSDLLKKDAELYKLKNEVRHLGSKNKALSGKVRKDESSLTYARNELVEKETSFNTKYEKLKELGSVLHASNIRMEPLHIKHNGKKEKITDKASKLDVLRIRFNIDENRIAEDGTKDLYLMVTGPDGKTLSNSGSITTNDGQTINYTVVKEISLRQNEPVKNVRVDCMQEGEHQKGIYTIGIYNDGYKIGSGSVALK